MKAIILISSIFYILGFKISYKFELLKKSHTVEKVITKTDLIPKQSKSINYSDELKAVCNTDSLENVNKSVKNIDETKHF